MDEEQMQKMLGCWGLIGLVFVVLLIVMGGTHRTVVTFKPQIDRPISSQVDFSESFTVAHWLGGLKQGEMPDITKALEKYVRPGGQVTEFTVVYRHTWWNYLCTGLTLFIYDPITVDVSGKVGKPATER